MLASTKKELKKYKKAFKKRQIKLINYIKNHYTEYKGEFAFIEINKILLENYLDYYSSKGNVWQSDETRLSIISQLEECLAIMNKIIADEYEVSAQDFAAQHCTKKKNSDGSYEAVWDTESSYQVWLSKMKLAEFQRMVDYKKVFKLIAVHCREWWD